ncbi:hypothetical protein BO94DRAFT_21858 [Aspergillus sclerotioniger CBS 115572]|uniref:Uncharacterized protein n=1 Tax=Aspergillus sclerotioniger CBS 115572 TaxID=1450535 RepID=A0A317WVA3_9EURO|nr:hypothetical protein BO94DRAFT_21858 [Aspergillus sclerotioniger CBS 115572]PWY90283.1 hypothetical protein BO94DRAFT_21858 [Aspergillus sclerotioniger CBS 115572]
MKLSLRPHKSPRTIHLLCALMLSEIREVCERILKVSKDIKILGRLDNKRSKLVSSAVRVMTTPQSQRPFKVYQEFLYDVLRAAGSSMVMLSSASLGKDRVVQLNAERRTILIDYIASQAGSLDSPALSSLAITFCVPQVEAGSRNSLVPTLESGLEGQAGASPRTQ